MVACSDCISARSDCGLLRIASDCADKSPHSVVSDARGGTAIVATVTAVIVDGVTVLDAVDMTGSGILRLLTPGVSGVSAVVGCCWCATGKAGTLAVAGALIAQCTLARYCAMQIHPYSHTLHLNFTLLYLT